jgi:alkylhydroperoxidase/carboxymuconolactone decarboxylase family protein YurZ
MGPPKLSRNDASLQQRTKELVSLQMVLAARQASFEARAARMVVKGVTAAAIAANKHKGLVYGLNNVLS